MADYGNGNITKKAENKFQLRWYNKHEGKYQSKTVNCSERQARKELNAIIAGINDGSYFKPQSLTVADFMTQYLEANKKRWANRTYQCYEEKTRNHIIPVLGKIAVEKLTATKIDKLLSDMQESGRIKSYKKDDKEIVGLSSQTAHHCRAILRSAINWGIKKDILQLRVNPVTKSDSVKVVANKKMEILTPEECNRLVEACSNSRWEMPIVLSLFTGMRQGECLGLHWSDVNFKTKEITVSHNLIYGNRKYSLKAPKNGKTRTFEVTDELIEVLKKQQEIIKLRKLEFGSAYNDLDLVCPREDGNFQYGGNLWAALMCILKQANIRTIRFHDLRHTHVSLSLAHGESVIRIAERVGHCKASITLDRYSHCIPGDTRAAYQFSNALKAAQATKK